MKPTYLFTEWILLSADTLVVILEGLLEHGGGKAKLFSEGLAALEALHQATADVVLAMPLDLLGGSTVEDEADRVLSHVIIMTYSVNLTE